MARCPFAIWTPLPENETQGKITPRKIIHHSAVSGAVSLHDFFNKSGIVVESHFYVRHDGTIEQYIDTAIHADANYKANINAVSIESEDGGNPDKNPWLPAQVDALVKLDVWICKAHNIPATKTTSATGSGIGYHSEFPSWSPVKKTCPGIARIPQMSGIINRVYTELKNPVIYVPPVLIITNSGEEDMVSLHRHPGPSKDKGKVFVTGGITKRWVHDSTEMADLIAAGILDSAVTANNISPLSGVSLDRIPTVG